MTKLVIFFLLAGAAGIGWGAYADSQYTAIAGLAFIVMAGIIDIEELIDKRFDQLERKHNVAGIKLDPIKEQI